MPSFREFADGLPRVGRTAGAVDAAGGITRPAARHPAFIEPTLTRRSGDPTSAAVVLVSAPAAVGKSVFAEALAADRGAPLWDLGQFPVGSGTFLGKLTETHGITALADVTEDISSGNYVVVLDALDEGYSLARSDNFEAFLIDLAKQLTELAPRRPAIVACGRTDTIDVTHLLLEDAGLRCSVFSLDFFSPEAARSFIDLRLDEVGHSAHRQFRRPFEQARDRLFEQIEAAIAADQESGGIDAQSFLGYAPVLIALAGYLRVGNYQALGQHLVEGGRPSTAGRADLWRLLGRIVVDLLHRERPKLIDKLAADLRSIIPTDRLEALYSPEEQCARLLARAARTPAPTVDLPLEALPEYEKSVNETLGEHPFAGDGPEGFASVVFRDYVIAEAISGRGNGSAARALAHRRHFKPAPLLFRFLVERSREQPAPRIEASDLDIVYASAQAEEFQDARAGLTVEPMNGELRAEIITAGGDLIEFVIADGADKSLSLGNRIARADVVAPSSEVIIGRAGEEARVGPDVAIGCDRILVAAASMRIEARTPDEAVTWQATRVDHDAPDFHLVGASRDNLRLAVSQQPEYPWTGFVADEAEPEADEPAMTEAIRELKKLVTRFKPGVVSGTAPTLPTRILDVLVARERVSPALHAYAIETGLITFAGKDAFLHPQQFGINTVDIRARRATPAIRAYLAGFIR